MIEELLSGKIQEYNPKNAIEQDNVLQELMQHYCLVSMAKIGFFKFAEFHGGTFLRIVHKLQRFSEDLDFVLKKPDPQFTWKKYLDKIQMDLQSENIAVEVQDKSKAELTVKKAFLKTDSIGKIILLKLPYGRYRNRKIKIKLEIDINPPEGSEFETHYINFPVMTAITCQTLGSSFAGKCHALLCREYVKGRDWYDFIWYVNRKIEPNLNLLNHALFQQGPWAGTYIKPSFSWLVEQLQKKIETLDWLQARKDVERFVPQQSEMDLNLWQTDFFLYHLNKLSEQAQVGEKKYTP